MGLTHDDEHAWTFDVPGTRVYCYRDADLALYDAANDEAWIACKDAPHLSDYR